MRFLYPNYPRETKLTSSQVRALKAIRDPKTDQDFFGTRGRSGGARRRMLNELVHLGFISGPPYELTPDGRDYLKATGK